MILDHFRPMVLARQVPRPGIFRHFEPAPRECFMFRAPSVGRHRSVGSGVTFPPPPPQTSWWALLSATPLQARLPEAKIGREGVDVLIALGRLELCFPQPSLRYSAPCEHRPTRHRKHAGAAKGSLVGTPPGFPLAHAILPSKLVGDGDPEPDFGRPAPTTSRLASVETASVFREASVLPDVRRITTEQVGGTRGQRRRSSVRALRRSGDLARQGGSGLR